jgi:ATP-dependent helicase/nuclease subunit B
MAERPGATPQRSTILIVTHALAAQQWEMHLAAKRLRTSATAWETPPVKSYAAWLDELWLAQADERGPALTPNQSLVLWRRVVAESAEGSELIGHAGAAEWAAGAWQLLHRWRLDPATQRAAANQVDYRAFLAWCRRYRAWLDANGWIDRAELEATLTSRVPVVGALSLADQTGPYPARTALFAQLAARGCRIDAIAAPAVTGTRHSARLADAGDELRAAFRWANRRLSSDPLARIAIVVPTAARRQDELERLAAHELDASTQACWTEGRTLAAEPTIGAALDALTLCGSHAAYATFGRWLRSPFFGVPRDEQFARARLDAELRTELRSQLPFQAAYRCGLKELLGERAPQSARALAVALGIVGGVQRATPSRWAHLWARSLAELGWQPPTARIALAGWQSALDELARLTPIVGETSFDGALTELARLLERTPSATLPLSGTHILRRIDDVGPGYDAVWATGFTDAAWPEPPHGNPLLPVAVQRAHGMPYSSPRDAEERSQRALERLVLCSPELVVSWPGRVYDYETEPSPAIRLWPALPTDALDALTTVRPLRTAARETVVDDAPPFAGTRVPGGTGALGRQARCPVRAFCQDRLGARALEPLRFGVSARLRGIATHRAAERLIDASSDQASLAAKQANVVPSVDAALTRLFGRARGYLAPLYELEAEHLQRVLTTLLREEALRAPFRVRTVEQEAAMALGPLTLYVRIDRIDELADGTIAIIDYKTGERATSADWFGERLRDAQVPLYATQATETVSAAVVARLALAQTRYTGFWPEGAFPGRPSRAAHPQRDVQLEIWRKQLEQLATEFAAGDARIFVENYDDAAGAYAPLTRVFEQLALTRGAATRW